jgi:hypothetical protein
MQVQFTTPLPMGELEIPEAKEHKVAAPRREPIPPTGANLTRFFNGEIPGLEHEGRAAYAQCCTSSSLVTVLTLVWVAGTVLWARGNSNALRLAGKVMCAGGVAAALGTCSFAGSKIIRTGIRELRNPPAIRSPAPSLAAKEPV